jgi:hypothetical protein
MKQTLSIKLILNCGFKSGAAERSAMESLLFTLKEGFEFADRRDAHENILAEMKKVLAYNISRSSGYGRSSQTEEMPRAAA